MRVPASILQPFLIAAIALQAYQPDPARLRALFEEQTKRVVAQFGPSDPKTAQSFRDLAFFLRDSGDREAAFAAFSKSLQADQARFGPNSPQAAAGLIALASVAPPKQAEPLLTRALESPGMNSRLAVPALSALGDLRYAAGNRAGAAAAWKLAMQHAELVNGKDSDAVAKLASSLSQAVPAKEAIELLERALSLAQQNFGESHPETATCRFNLAQALLKAGHPAEAVAQINQAIPILEASLGSGHPRVKAARDLTSLAARSAAR